MPRQLKVHGRRHDLLLQLEANLVLSWVIGFVNQMYVFDQAPHEIAVLIAECQVTDLADKLHHLEPVRVVLEAKASLRQHQAQLWVHKYVTGEALQMRKQRLKEMAVRDEESQRW